MTLDELESNPGFIRATAEEQTRLRNSWTNEFLVPEVQSVGGTATDFIRIQNTVLRRAPVLETQDESANEYRDLGRSVVEGDPGLFSQAAGRFLARRVSEDFGITSAIVRGIGNIIGVPQYENAADEAVRRDRAKAYDYFMRGVRTDNELGGLAQAADVAVPVLGAITDMILTRNVVAGGLKIAGATKLAGLIQGTAQFSTDASKAIGTTSRVVNWLATRGGPQVIQSAFDAVTMTVANFSNDNFLRDTMNQPRTGITFQNVALQFGKEFAIDYAMFGAFQFLAPIGRSFFRAMGGLPDVLKGTSEVEKMINTLSTEDLARRVATGDLPEELIAALPSDLRASAKFNKNYHQIDLMLGTLDEQGQIYAQLRAKGFDLVPTGKTLDTTIDRQLLDIKAQTDAIDAQLKVLKAADVDPRIKLEQIKELDVARETNLRSMKSMRDSTIEGYDLYDIRSGKMTKLGKFTDPGQALEYTFKTVDDELSGIVRNAPEGSLGMSMQTKEIANAAGDVTRQADLIRVREVVEVARPERIVPVSQKLGQIFDPARSGEIAGSEVKELLDTINDNLNLGLKKPKKYLPNEVGAYGDNGFEGARGIKQLDDKIQIGLKWTKQNSFSSSIDVRKELLRDLNSVLEPTLSKTTKGRAILAEIQGSYQNYARTVTRTEWADAMITSVYPAGSKIVRNADGSMQLLVREGGQPRGSFMFANDETLNKHLYQKMLDEKLVSKLDYDTDLQVHLKSLGMSMEMTDEVGSLARYVVRNADGSIVDSAASLDEIITKNPYLAPKLPAELAPMAVVSPEAVHLGGNVVSGDIETILDQLSKFEIKQDALKKAVLEVTGDRVVSLNKVTKLYEVDIPGMRWKGRFESKGDLEKFIKQGYENSTSLTYIGSQKGAQVVWANGEWLIRHIDGHVDSARNLDELKTKISDLPANAHVGKELTDISPELNEFLSDELAEFRRPIESKLNAWSKDQVDDAMNRALKQGGYGQETPGWLGVNMTFGLKSETMKKIAMQTKNLRLIPRFTAYDSALTQVRVKTTEVEKLLHKAWDKIPANERMQLTPLLQYSPEQWSAKLAELQVGARKPLEITEKYRTALNEHKRITERYLRMEFGVNAFRAQTDYLPRIKDYLLKNKDRIVSEFASSKDPRTYLADVLGKEFGSANTDWFAQNMRLDDMGEFIAAVDPIDITMAYARSGYKNKYLAPEFNKFLAEVRGSDLAPEYRNYFFEFLNDSMGWGSDFLGEGLEMASAGLNRFFEILKVKGGLTGSVTKVTQGNARLVNSVQRLTVGATMAMRMGLSLRNVHQIYTVGSLFQPLDAIQEGSRRMADIMAKPQEFMDKFINTGLLKPNLTPIGTQMSSHTALDMFNKFGMRAYMNSDTMNRITMYMATEASWDRAAGKLAKLGNERMNFKNFLKWTEADLLPPADQTELMRLWSERGTEAAKAYHATRVVELTQFTYNNLYNPRYMGRTTIGRIVGMFGHYPVSYAETLRQTFAQRRGEALVRTVGRFAVVSTAIAAVHSELGLDPTSYTPWGQIMFTGGPHARLFITAIDSLDMRSFEGAQARAQIGREAAQILVPGSALARSWGQAIELADSGDSYGAMLKFMSMPYVGNAK